MLHNAYRWNVECEKCKSRQTSNLNTKNRTHTHKQNAKCLNVLPFSVFLVLFITTLRGPFIITKDCKKIRMLVLVLIWHKLQALQIAVILSTVLFIYLHPCGFLPWFPPLNPQPLLIILFHFLLWFRKEWPGTIANILPDSLFNVNSIFRSLA